MNKMILKVFKRNHMVGRSIYNPNKKDYDRVKVKNSEDLNKQTILSFLKFINNKKK